MRKIIKPTTTVSAVTCSATPVHLIV